MSETSGKAPAFEPSAADPTHQSIPLSVDESAAAPGPCPAPVTASKRAKKPPANPQPVGKAGGDVATGNATSTVENDRSAKRMYDRLMVEAGECKYGEITDYCDLQEYVIIFADLLVHAGLRKTNGDYYSTQVLSQYWRSICKQMKRDFPNNNNSKSLNDATFLEESTKKFNTVAHRARERGKNEDGFVTKTLPLFRETKPGLEVYRTYNVECGFDSARNDGQMKPVGVDLKTILRSLFASAQFGTNSSPFQKMLLLNLTWAAIGRGGEPKFLSYDKMYWEPHFQCVVCKWLQIKQLTVMPTSFTRDASIPELCVLSTFALYWMMEQGLSREEGTFDHHRSNAYRHGNKVFPDYARQSEGSLTKAMNRFIRDNIPAACGDAKDLFTIKSLRYGGATTVQSNKTVTFDSSLARGGWASGTSRDNYTFILLVLILAPMMALAGFPDPDCEPVMPRLNILVRETPYKHLNQPLDWNGINRLLDQLYLISVPSFLPGGRLRPMLEVCTACLIMNFDHFFKTYGGRQHPVILKMVECLCRSRIIGINSYQKAEEQYREWSAMLRKDVEDRMHKPVDPRAGEIRSRLMRLETKQMAELVELRDAVSRMNERVGASNAAAEGLAKMLKDEMQRRSTLETTVCRMEGMIQQQTLVMQQLLSIVSSIPGVDLSTAIVLRDLPLLPSLPSIFGGVPGAVTGPELSAGLHNVDTDDTNSSTNSSAQSEKKRSIDDVLMGSRGKQPDGFKIKNVTVPDVLLKLFDENQFKRLGSVPLWQMITVFHAPQDRSKFVWAMKMADAMWSSELRQDSIDRSMDRSLINQRYKSLGKLIVRATTAMEGQLKPAPQRKSAISGVANSVIAFGRLDKFLPDWNNEGRTPAGETLLQWVERRENELKEASGKE